MTIGNALDSKIAVASFSRLATQIGTLQARISSGVNDPRPSADLARAAELSSLRERRSALTDFSANADAAAGRLALTDTALGDLGDLAVQFQSIALQAANATQTDAGLDGLRSQAQALRAAMLGDLNSTDANGIGLFSGYGAGPAFQDGANGVTYAGDGGQPVARLSENLVLPTGVNGKTLTSVTTTDGQKDLMGMVDDLIAALQPTLRASTATATVTADSARLSLNAGRQPQSLSFTLQGPNGSAKIDTTMQADVPGPTIDAINAQTAQTGVTASLTADGKGIALTAAGGMTLSDMATGTADRAPVGTLQPLDSSGAVTGTQQVLRPAALDMEVMIGNFDAANTHLADQRAGAGAIAAQVDRQKESLASRGLQLDIAVSGLNDLDVAKAITDLQNLLITQDAAQQSYVKIQSKSLFDYIS